MSEPATAPTEMSTPPANAPANQSEGTKNTSNNQELFDKAYGLGINKGQKELLESLGVDNADVLKKALESYKSTEEAQKTAAEKLAEFHAENKALKTELEAFRARRDKELENALSSLEDDDRDFFKGLNLPPDQLFEVVGKFKASPKSAPSKSVAPVNPPANQQAPVNVIRATPGIDPEFRKDPAAYRNRLIEQMANKSS